LKYIHVCYDLKFGGVTSFIQSVVNLNGVNDTVHDVYVINTEFNQELYLECKVFTRNKTFNDFFYLSRKIISDYDAVFLHSAHPLVVLPMILSYKGKVFIFQHGMTVSTGAYWKNVIKKAWYTIVPFLLNSKIICSTEFAKKKNRLNGIFIPQSRYIVIPFGAYFHHRKEINIPDDKNTMYIGMAGRMVKQKRFDRILKLLNAYEGQNNLHLRIAGEGPEKQILQKLAENIRGEKIKIEFLGNIKDMARFYQALDIFILPSKGESFGLVVIEALLHNVPVAVYDDVGGALELIKHNINGFVLHQDQDMIELLDELACKPDLLLKLKKYCQHLDLRPYQIATTRKTLEKLVIGGYEI